MEHRAIIQHYMVVMMLYIDTCLAAVPGFECNNIELICETNTDHDALVNKNVDINYQCNRNSRLCTPVVTCRVRYREPSRASLQIVLNSLKCRKLRKKCKILVKISVPASSVLYSIATYFKQRSIRYTKRQDRFYGNYFVKSKIFTVIYN